MRGFQQDVEIDNDISLNKLKMITGLKPCVKIPGKNIAFEIIQFHRVDGSKDFKVHLFYTVVHLALPFLYKWYIGKDMFINHYDLVSFCF